MREEKTFVTNSHYSNWIGTANYVLHSEHTTKEEAQHIAEGIRRDKKENARITKRGGKYLVWTTWQGW